MSRGYNEVEIEFMSSSLAYEEPFTALLNKILGAKISISFSLNLFYTKSTLLNITLI